MQVKVRITNNIISQNAIIFYVLGYASAINRKIMNVKHCFSSA